MSKIDSADFLYNVRIHTGFVVTNFKIASKVEESCLIEGQDSNLEYNLPGGCDVSFPQEFSEDDIMVNVKETKKPRLTSYKGEYNLYGPLSNPNFFKQFPYLAYTLGERERSHKYKAVTMHAAAVGIDSENGLLILGDKGSGKTSLALSLVIREGLSLIGNDLVLVANKATNALSIMDGTKMINARFAVVDNLFGDRIKFDSSGKHPYEDKIYIKPEEINLRVATVANYIKAVVRVNIHPGNEVTRLTDGPRRVIETLRIYENLLRYIKGSTTPLMLREAQSFGYIPSLEDRITQDVRDEMINRMLDLPFYYLTTNDPIEGARALLSAIK